jgi:hypothetical protein
MKDISIFKKLELFFLYKKVVNSNRLELKEKYNIRIDSAYRLYTVLNIPESLLTEYSIKKSDMDIVTEKYIREYSTGLSNFLREKGLTELFNFYENRRVDKYSFLIVFGFSLFQSQKFYNNLYYIIYPIIYLLLTSFLIYIIY